MGGAGLIVLDTCAIIWLVSDPGAITRAANQAIREVLETRSAYFSTISNWEIALAFSRRRIEFFDHGYKEFTLLLQNNFPLMEINIKPEIAELSVSLPPEINKDPADRIIAATSIVLDAPLVTADKN